MNTTWKASLPYREVYYRDAKVCNNLKEIVQDQYVCGACELSIKIRKIMVRYTSSGRHLLCSILFLCLLEGGLAYGWLLSDVVGSHYTNATKQIQILELFRLIIVLVSLHVATSYLDLKGLSVLQLSSSYTEQCIICKLSVWNI